MPFMKAVHIDQFGGVEVLQFGDTQRPTPGKVKFSFAPRVHR